MFSPLPRRLATALLGALIPFHPAFADGEIYTTLTQCLTAMENARRLHSAEATAFNSCHKGGGRERCDPISKRMISAQKEYGRLTHLCNQLRRTASSRASDGSPSRTIIPMDQIANPRESDGRPKVTVIPNLQNDVGSQPDPVSEALRDIGRNLARNHLPEWMGDLLESERPSASAELERAEEATDEFKDVLQEHAMPGQSGAAARRLQDAAIPVIRDTQRKHEGVIGGFASSNAGTNIVDSGRSTAPAYRPPPVAAVPSQSNPFNEPTQHRPVATPPVARDGIPTIRVQESSEPEMQPTPHSGWQPVHREPESTYRQAPPSSRNPWSNSSETHPTVVAQAGADGARNNNGGSVSACDLVRRGEVQFRYKWKDKTGSQCYSNTSNGQTAAVCCR